VVVSPHDRGAWAVTSQLWLVWPGGGQGWRVSLWEAGDAARAWG